MKRSEAIKKLAVYMSELELGISDLSNPDLYETDYYTLFSKYILDFLENEIKIVPPQNTEKLIDLETGISTMMQYYGW